jgi:hypothetical protein
MNIRYFLKYRVKNGEVYTRKGHKGPRGSRGIAVLSVQSSVLKYLDEGYVDRNGFPGRIS